MKSWLIGITALCLSACDQAPPEKTVWDEQLKTMDKAHEAEQQMLEAAELQRQAIEQQTQQ
ncbi:MAG: hypothetical protein VX841_11460 [Pseudomonadota bacterium]|nr:hypothetical protein [Pseudomonadota bacterium]